MSRNYQADDVYVVVAPSGTGKTTLNSKLVHEFKEKIELSISHTTRPQRPMEKDGEHYHFTTEEIFMDLANSKMLLEWANVFGNLYGTSITEIDRIRKKGKKILIEIDVQGWHYAKKRLPGATSIFIMSPSVKEVWKRLENRGTDSLSVRWKRIQTSKKELECAEEYEHFILNENIDQAYEELKSVIFDEEPKLKLTREEGIAHSKRLLEEFESATWLKRIGHQAKLEVD